ncbi:MAG: sigma 54-interacting transcriptional regulator [Thermodesulfobacteriota bacterium]
MQRVKEKKGHHLNQFSVDIERCRDLIERGNYHRRSFDYSQARQCYEELIDHLMIRKGDDPDHLLIQAALEYAKFPADDSESNRTITVLREACRRSISGKDKGAQALLEMNLARTEWLRSRFSVAFRHFDRGFTLAEEFGDPSIQRSAHIFRMFFHYWSGHFRDVIKTYEMIVPDVEKFSKESFPLLAALTAGSCFGYCGQISQGLGMLDAIRVHAKKLNNLYISGHAGMVIGHLLLDVHRLEEARQCIEESLKEAVKSRNLFVHLSGLARLSHLYFLMNDPQKSVSVLQQFAELSHKVHMPTRHGPSILYLTWAMERGELPRNHDLSLEREIASAGRDKSVFNKGLAFRYQAFLLKWKGAPAHQVISALKRSIQFLKESGHQIERATSEIELAREYLWRGREELAREWAIPAAKVLNGHHEALVPDDIRPLILAFRSEENLLQQILRLGQELVAIRDNRDLFRKIISTVNRITGAERGAVFLKNSHDPSGVVLRAAINLTADDIASPEFSPPLRFIKETFKTGKGQSLDLEERKRTRLLERNKILSCICVPMIIRDRVVGVLYHDNRLFHSAFKEGDLEILNYFAAQAAIAMDNAQAWEAFQEMYEKQQREKKYYEEQYLENIHFEDFVGKSDEITKVFQQAEQVAGTDSTVLIIGETGVGKELVARYIHHHSSRRDKPFIRVHCSALPESLISSELFGHEKGAFTGAISRQIGRFELANGGTLFLDEIGDVSMEIQVKLLRVLQYKEFERVGGHETLRSNFRLLAATHRDLTKEIQAGRFRQDLYYRLSVFPIAVPPLRERREDIPLLAEYFLKNFVKKFNKPQVNILQEDMKRLLSYEWPGNVRELENVIERGLILSQGSRFRIPPLDKDPLTPPIEGFETTLEDVERNHILRILAKTEGKISGPGGAAKILNLPTGTLRSRMKKLKIFKQTRSLYARQEDRK